MLFAVEKVGDEDDFTGMDGLRFSEDGESLTIGMKVEIADTRPAVGELLLGPDARLVEAERVELRCIARDHDFLVGSTVEKILTFGGPRRILTASRRNLPRAAWSAKREDVDFFSSRFVRVVGEPFSVRRESRVLLSERRGAKNG